MDDAGACPVLVKADELVSYVRLPGQEFFLHGSPSTEAFGFFHIMYAESGEQRYERQRANAPRRRDGGYDMRYAASRFAAAYERGDVSAVNYGLITIS